VGGNIAGIENDNVFNGCNGKGGSKENREEGPAPGVWQLEEGEGGSSTDPDVVAMGRTTPTSAWCRMSQGWAGVETSQVGRPGEEEKERVGPTQQGILKFEFQVELELIWSKGCLPMLKKIGIKYVWKGFELKNKFPYRNFPIFEKDLK
jgi:hypothetical protein